MARLAFRREYVRGALQATLVIITIWNALCSPPAAAIDGAPSKDDQREIIRAALTGTEACTSDQKALSAEIVATVLERSQVDGGAILVDKTTHSLGFFVDGELLREFSVGVGSPGDKETEGDSKTPVGLFEGCKLVRTSAFGDGYAILLDYPDAADAERGLLDGLITRSQHDAIVAADRRHGVPPMNTALGGLIEIHASGEEAWFFTTGCITLVTEEMNELFALVEPLYDKGRTIAIGVVACL